MNQEQKDRWVAALRSGEFKQGRGSLAYAYVEHLDDDKEIFELRNCCLGVGLCVLPEEGTCWEVKGDSIALWCGDSIFTAMPPHSWQRFAGLNRQIGVEAWEYISNHIANPGDDLLPTTAWSFILTFLNDQVPATFDQIADIIERFLPVDD